MSTYFISARPCHRNTQHSPKDLQLTASSMGTAPSHATWMLPKFASTIKQLSEAQLNGKFPLDPALRLFAEDDLECWYTPFEQINPSARIVLVGITPGKTQLLNGLWEAKNKLIDGADIQKTLAAAKQAGAFSGEMRQHLVALLDHIGFAQWLGLQSTQELFSGKQELLHSTSCLRHAVFYKGQNYNGTPNMLRQPVLRKLLLDHFAVEAASLKQAVFVPLGEKAAQALDFVASEGIVKPAQIFPGLPHPSPANIERIQFFIGKKHQSALSPKTNGPKLLAARTELERRVLALTSASVQNRK